MEQVIRINGEDELNNIRERAREIAPGLNLAKEFERLNSIISALLSTCTQRIRSLTGMGELPG